MKAECPHTKFMNSTHTERMKSLLTKFAETDLRYARKEGSHIVAQTQHGNLTITAWPDKRGYAINSAAGLLYSGTKAGAVECLVNAYQVVAE